MDEWKQMCGTMGMSSQRPLKHESRLRIRPLKQHKETYLSWRIRNLKFLDFECRPYGIKPPIRQLTCLLCGCFRMFPSFVYWRFVNFSDLVATSLATKTTALTILLFEIPRTRCSFTQTGRGWTSRSNTKTYFRQRLF